MSNLTSAAQCVPKLTLPLMSASFKDLIICFLTSQYKSFVNAMFPSANWRKDLYPMSFWFTWCLIWEWVLKNEYMRTSLVVQHLRLWPLMQGAWILGQGTKIPCAEQGSQKKKRMYKWIKESVIQITVYHNFSTNNKKYWVDPLKFT